MHEEYPVPAAARRSETWARNSRFIATVRRVATVAKARAALAEIRAELPEASHHVYAFRVGFGNSVQEGMSDDGEPVGTAGPPVLAILRGAGIGDVLIVVTRYFGGTKLGTGGLVRAYSDAARQALANLPTGSKVARGVYRIECSYALYERVKRLVPGMEGRIDESDFGARVTLRITLPRRNLAMLQAALREFSAGRVEALPLD